MSMPALTSCQCHPACCVALSRLLASLNQYLQSAQQQRAYGRGFGPHRPGVLCPVTFLQVASPHLSWEPDILPGTYVQTVGMVASGRPPLPHAGQSCCYFCLLLVNLRQRLGVEPASRCTSTT